MAKNILRCNHCSSKNVIFKRDKNVYICEDCQKEISQGHKFHKLRIFISYGRDEYVTLAERLKTDLEKRCHDVWFDKDKIREGVDWEQYIDEGLNMVGRNPETGRFILIMTPHSVRRPDGYCLNEIAKALTRSVPIIPIMLVRSEPPLSIYRLQYLDMQDCFPPTENDISYEKGFERLVLALEEKKLDFEGSQSRILKVLDPIIFTADVSKLLSDFTGREWLLKKIDQWLNNSEGSKIFWITGDPGTGKSAIAAWIRENKREIAAFHFCDIASEEKRDPTHMVRSIAYQLSTQLPAYEERLKGLGLELIIKEYHKAYTLFDKLIIQPLADNFPHPDRTIVILIDALDEATYYKRNEIALFLSRCADKTPPWLRFFITSRPEPEVCGPLQFLSPCNLDTSSEDNLLDIKSYLRKKLHSITDEQIETLVKKSEGVFLYVRHVCDEIRLSRMCLDDLEHFPQGLGGVFWQFFERQFPDIDKFSKDIRPALRTILAAREPLQIEVVQKLFMWSEEELRDFMRTIGSLFSVIIETDKEIIKPYHKSLVDWLGDEAKAGPYFVSVKEGNRILADKGWQFYVSDSQVCPYYFIAHLPYHMLVCEEWKKVYEILTDIKFLEQKVINGLSYEILQDFSEAKRRLPEDSKYHNVLNLLHEALRRDINFIARHSYDYPQALFQCMWNSCYWFDSPEAAKHYAEFNEGGNAGEFLPWQRHDSRLSMLMKSWLAEKKKRSGDFIWLRQLRPPAMHLGAFQKAVLLGHEDRVLSVACSTDGKYVASGSADNTIRVWDARSSQELFCLQGHKNWVRCVTFSNNGRWIISGAQDDTVRIWDVKKKIQLRCICGHEGWIRAVAISPDGTKIASGSDDCTIRIWNVENGSETYILHGHKQAVNSVAFSPDSRYLASASEDATVRTWDTRTGVQLKCFCGHDYWVTSVGYSPDGKKVVSAGDISVRVWDFETGLQLGCLRGHNDWVLSVDWSRDGQKIVSCGYDKTIRVWNALTFKELSCLRGHLDWVRSVVYAPDGRRIMSGSNDFTLRIWGTEEIEGTKRIKGHDLPIKIFACSPDGKLIASGSEDYSVRVWETRTGGELFCLRGHEACVTSLVFSPDGNRIASGSEDCTVRIWDVQAGTPLFCLHGISDAVHKVFYSSDGKYIFVRMQNDKEGVWCADTGYPLDKNDRSEFLNLFENFRIDSNGEFPSQVASFRVFPRGFETIVEDLASKKPLAYFPIALYPAVSVPKSRVCAGAEGAHLHIVDCKGSMDLTVNKNVEALKLNKHEVEQNSFFEGVLNKAHGVVFVVDQQERVVFLNKKGLMLTGYGVADLVGKYWFEITDKTYGRDLFYGSKPVIKSNASCERLRTRDGQILLLQWFSAPSNSNKEQSSQNLLIGEDVTGLRFNKFIISQELQSLDKEAFLDNALLKLTWDVIFLLGYSDIIVCTNVNEQNSQMVIRLHQAIGSTAIFLKKMLPLLETVEDNNKTLFVSRVCHELNNLLPAVVGYCELLALGLTENEQNRIYIKKINEIGRDMSKILALMLRK